MEFPDPCTPQGLDALQSHLSSRSYVSGHAASRNDAKVFAAISARGEPADKERHADVVRWYRHMRTGFSPEERKALPEAPEEVVVLKDPGRAKQEEVAALETLRCSCRSRLSSFLPLSLPDARLISWIT